MQDYVHSRIIPGFSAHLRRLSLAAPVLALVLGACASTRELPPREAMIVAPVEAMILPPPGGPGIVNVVSTTFPNAIQQEISLATQARTAGENKISVIQFIGKGGDGSDARLRDIPFTQVNLTEEALAAWPGTGMAVSPYYVQNDYGPFGYAIGRPANGDVCIYAWQRIEPALRPARGTIMVRLQLCKRGGGEQDLLEVMYRLRFNGSVFAPGAAPVAIGRVGAPLRPVGAQGFATVLPVPVVQPPRPAAPVVVPVVVTAPPPGVPVVPSPGGGSAGGPTPTVPRPPASTVVVPSPSGSR